MTLAAATLTEPLAKIAAGSMLVTALIAAMAVFGLKSSRLWFKAVTVVAGLGVVVLAIVLYSSNEKTKLQGDQAAQARATRCESLLATVRQGLKDKLLLERDLASAKQIAQGLIATMDASSCKEHG
jgi:dienelactone hydrolase